MRSSARGRRPAVRLAPGLVRRAFAIALLTGWAVGAMPEPLRPGATLAASCNGASHTLALADGTASPGSGPYGTTFAFRVRYIDNADCPATSVVVTIPGVGSFPLAPLGVAPAGGLLYGAGVALPPGTWTYQFEASSGSGAGAEAVTLTTVTPAVISVIAPATPPPTPPPTPKPTPRPTARPTPRPTPVATPIAPPTPSPTPVATASPVPSGSPVTGAGGSTTGGTGGPSIPPDAVPGQRDGVATARRPANAAANGDGPSGRRSTDAATGLGTGSPVSFGVPTAVPLPALAWSISTLGGLMVFAVILRRRDVRGSSIRVAGIGSPVGNLAPALSGDRVEGALEPDDDEPSPPDASTVGGASHLGPIGPSAARPPLRFDRKPARGVERRIVSYQGVRVGDGPDSVRSVELGRLERGDEVEVLEWRAGTVLVRAPGGLEGWIHGAAIIGGYASDDA